MQLVVSLVLLQLLLLSPTQQVDNQTSPSSNEVCYKGIGCFRNDGIWHSVKERPISNLPESPEKLNTQFALFTRRNKNRVQWLKYNDPQSVRNSFFSIRKDLKIVIHGYTDKIDSGWMLEFKDALLQHGDYNVLLVDWSGGNQFPYWQATANSRVAGAVTAQMLLWLESQFGANRFRMHILGQSLGAHVAGYVGRLMQGKLDRITGMDPAGPFFEYMHRDVRLDETDATFVDVIHTDAGPNWDIIQMKGGFGLMQPSGHVDFYPNGGKKQPACDDEEEAGRIVARQRNDELACNHIVVIPMTIATILNPDGQYSAVPCDSYENFKAGSCKCGSIGCASMGMSADKWRSGGRKNVKMFLDTAATSPYELKP